MTCVLAEAATDDDGFIGLAEYGSQDFAATCICGCKN
jgi:hypothetical protein